MGETSSEVAQQAPPPPQPEQIQPVAQGDSDTEFAPPTSATLPDGVAEDGSEAVGPGGFPVQPDPGEGPGFTLPENE